MKDFSAAEVTSLERFLEVSAKTFAVPRKRLERLLFLGQPAAKARWDAQRKRLRVKRPRKLASR
jgi:hypothetical protein